MAFESLFTPYVLKGKTIKNRFTVPAMVANYCTKDGFATERYIAYHEKKAKGGWGLIITEDYAVDPLGKGFSYVAGLWNDDQIEGHSELTKRVKAHGSTIIAQIYHAGRQTNEGVIGDIPVAPSPLQCPFSPNIPKELTIKEIEEIVSKFGDTALRAKKCGFDGIEIHGGHGYLVAEFMSLYSNKRVDEYGGKLNNRMKFPLEIIADIRKKCGDDFIVGFRISADEFIEGGRTIEDTKAIVKMLEEAGVDIVHVSAGVYASADAVVPPYYTNHGWITDFALAVKGVCDIPVITVGRINDPFVAESVIVSGKADFVAMGRASLVDPKLPIKTKEGRLAEARQCIGCNHGCLGILFADQPIKCVLNPELGNEYKDELKKSDSSKNVAVVGAGPAGLEAAIYAARLGHQVTVFEKSDKAGGQLYIASIPPAKGEIAAFIQWQLNTLGQLGVSIMYNTEVTAKYLADHSFDKIIIATGAKPTTPSIPGVELPHVVGATDLLTGKVSVGFNVVVIGGGQVGAETASHLGAMLKGVTLVEMLPGIALEEAMAPRIHLLKALENRKVNIMVNTVVEEIKEASVVLKSGDTLCEVLADSVVIATGSTSDNGLAKDLEEKGYCVHVIGDAAEVGNILGATEQGYQAALSL